MAVELHLPDLPEVPISLGPVPGQRRARPPWHQRLRSGVSNALPLLTMALLALGSWWLVKHSPGAAPASEDAALRTEPDYTMSRFAVERFDASGQLKLRIEGEQMRHFPDTDRIEIDAVRIRSVAPGGRVTLAHARRAVSNGDGTQVQLLGGAQVDSRDATGRPLQIQGEFLHAFLDTERLRSHLPVTVVQGASRIQADGLEYDHLARLLELKGRMRAVFAAPARKG